MSVQSPDSVVMIRPLAFAPNTETIADNFFQAREPIAPTASVAEAAFGEVTRMAQQLADLGVKVYLFDDPEEHRPDSVFPNNWFSTHPDGRVALYPMFAPSRRAERRSDIIAALRGRFQIIAVHDYSVLEDDGRYLEGTGAMVFDHVHRIAYVARSLRSDEQAVDMVCRDLDYRPVKFATRDRRGAPIYHTNVMMAVGSTIAVVALDAIADTQERKTVQESLQSTGHTIVALSLEQLEAFACNTIEVTTDSGPRLVMSSRGYESLNRSQRRAICEHAELLAISVPTVELAGGSVRCMIAGIHLPLRPDRALIPHNAESSLAPALSASALR